MLVLTVQDTKSFMSLLLKGSIFDNFSLRQLDMQSYAFFQITGLRNIEYYNEEEQDKGLNKYCLWSEIKPFAFSLVKGNRLPKSIKLIFSLKEEEMNKLFENASALFINLTFIHPSVTITTGVSQKNFILDKSLEHEWDAWVLDFFLKNDIGVLNREVQNTKPASFLEERSE